MADVRCLLAESATMSKHELAIVAPDAQLLYHEAEERVLHATANLLKIGCSEGARVGIWMDNDWRQLLLVIAIIRAGGTAVLFGARWPVAMVERQARRMGCRAVIVDERHREEITAGLGQALDAGSLLTFATDLPSRDIRIPLEHPATIVFTSGSSGQPRGVQLSYGNHYYSALGANANVRLHSRDRWLLSLPMHHVGGLGILFRCLHAGATVVLPGPGQALTEAQDTVRATHLSLVHTQLHRLLAAGELSESFKVLKAVLLGGGPIDGALVAAAIRKGLPVFASYGLTEMASQVTTVTPATPPRWRATSGTLLRRRQIRMAADGEILVRGETLFQGYVSDPGPAVPAVDEDGWFHTGDVGRLDDQGYLSVDGRKDFMFVCGGENVHPEEIELCLAQVPGVERAIVVGVADAELGRRPVAFVQALEVDEKALAKALAAVLPLHKVPRTYLPWPAEWDMVMGKVNRREAEQRAEKEKGGT